MSAIRRLRKRIRLSKASSDQCALSPTRIFGAVVSARIGGRQPIAGSDSDVCDGSGPAAEPLDQRRLADASLATQEHQPTMTRGGLGQNPVKSFELGGALQEFHTTVNQFAMRRRAIRSCGGQTLSYDRSVISPRRQRGA